MFIRATGWWDVLCLNGFCSHGACYRTSLGGGGGIVHVISGDHREVLPRDTEGTGG